MRIPTHLLLSILLVLAATWPLQLRAEASSGDGKFEALVAQHRLIASTREIEAMARELYYDQSFILLYVHGNRTEHIGSYGDPPRMLTQAVQSRFVPPLRRFRFRLDRLDLSDVHEAALVTALDSIDVAIEAGYDIAEQLRRDDSDSATSIFHERSLPAFKQAWRDLYTVISDLERSPP